jgi:hypothetical protein
LFLLLGVPTQATASIDTSALVGSTAGGLSINQGAANYTIPITVPPGIAGMQPELSINYNSNAGNGQLGVGFWVGMPNNKTNKVGKVKLRDCFSKFFICKYPCKSCYKFCYKSYSSASIWALISSNRSCWI